VNRLALSQSGWPCPTGDEMRRIDARAIEGMGLPAHTLMENAGRAAAAAIRGHYPDARRPLVLCGGGNNGGDGFVVARVLGDWDSRIRPLVVALGEASRRSPESRQNLDLLSSLGTEVAVGPDSKEIAQLAARCDLVVDAVFGVGLSRAVEGPVAEVLGQLAEVRAPIVSLDLPSGVSSETGETLGVDLRPDLVVTFGLPKLGLAVRPLEASICVADIGLPWAAVAAEGVRQHVLTPAAAAARLPARPTTGHKGTFGHVLVIGGSEGKTGAACLAATGALRAGAGLVTAAAPRSLHPIYEAKLTEAMTLPVDDGPGGVFGEGSAQVLLKECAARDCAVIGPGVGGHEQTVRALERLLAGLRTPAVLDADALNAFAGRPEVLRAPGARILTPHPGEMARLLERSTEGVQRDRVAAARELAARAGAVVLLKGARSVVASPEGDVLVNPTGGPGLASGGTGDVLSGVVGALVAQGAAPFEAAGLGAYLHGRAGDAVGQAGGIAGDVARALPGVWTALAQAAEAGEGTDGGDLLRRFP
jgi:NAD(P)H-hydrate epimerase